VKFMGGTPMLRQPITRTSIRRVFSPTSMVPNWQDVKQFFKHMRWMLFLGPRPRFDRWAYYEKFDYWAVFWGVAIIGSSGLIMALASLFAQLLPGWVFNVALIIHGEEALLATSFLFLIHFFHVHIRPEKFPMDEVIFTGRIREEVFAHERPAEYERIVAEGKLEQVLVEPPSRSLLMVSRLIGFGALAIGIVLIVCIVCTEIYGHFFPVSGRTVNFSQAHHANAGVGARNSRFSGPCLAPIPWCSIGTTSSNSSSTS